MRYAVIKNKEDKYELKAIDPDMPNQQILAIVEIDSDKTVSDYTSLINSDFNQPLSSKDLYSLFEDLTGVERSLEDDGPRVRGGVID